MSRGHNGPRQPGGGRQQAGPRHRQGQRGMRVQDARRHPEVLESKRRAWKGDGQRKLAVGDFRRAKTPRSDKPEIGGRASFEARQRRAPQDDGESLTPKVAAARKGSQEERQQAAQAEGGEAGKVQTLTVTPDESGMRVDRFFEARFPGLSFSHIQRIVRKGEVRVNGKRTETKARLAAGQSVRVPPLSPAPPPREDAPQAQKDRAFLKSIALFEDDDVLVLNKPMGLAVQGGSGTTRHVDGMLGSLRGSHPDAQRPRLVHRLDKDTAGCLLIAKTRFAASALAKTFRSRSARKIYWALVAGVPRPHQGRISTYLAKQEVEEDSFMRIAKHGDKDAVHAVTYYAVIETSAQKLAWISLKPVTGRTHQLRAHMAHVGHPIVGDPKYFNIENWEFPGGIQDRLHLLARRIVVPHPRGGTIDVSAPLPPHMQQSWNLLGFDAQRYDPIVEAPEE
jgi:23S rRNA pseudouridine955/2504/2580 synthase